MCSFLYIIKIFLLEDPDPKPEFFATQIRIRIISKLRDQDHITMMQIQNMTRTMPGEI